MDQDDRHQLPDDFPAGIPPPPIDDAPLLLVTHTTVPAATADETLNGLARERARDQMSAPRPRTGDDPVGGARPPANRPVTIRWVVRSRQRTSG